MSSVGTDTAWEKRVKVCALNNRDTANIICNKLSGRRKDGQSLRDANLRTRSGRERSSLKLASRATQSTLPVFLPSGFGRSSSLNETGALQKIPSYKVQRRRRSGGHNSCPPQPGRRGTHGTCLPVYRSKGNGQDYSCQNAGKGSKLSQY